MRENKEYQGLDLCCLNLNAILGGTDNIYWHSC